MKPPGMKRVLITGSRGQLGSDLSLFLEGRAAVTGVDLPELDVRDRTAVESCVRQARPDIVVNCAAFTQVDLCETSREIAFDVNAGAPGFLAGMCAERRVAFAHVSTDYVFDGSKPVGGSYTEADAPCPLSVYGASKLAGENAVMRSGADALVVRTAWLYGRNGANFPKAIIRKALAAGREPLRVVNDQHGSPTWSRRLAEQIWVALEGGLRGICHASAEGSCTWRDFAVEVLKRMKIEREVLPCGAAEFPRPAVRPRNAVLENARLKAAGLNVMIDWRRDVGEFVGLFCCELAAECGKG
jgi:dTDP-4-dehydrorhamnose reductase